MTTTTTRARGYPYVITAAGLTAAAAYAVYVATIVAMSDPGPGTSSRLGA